MPAENVPSTPETWYQEILEAREQHFKERRIDRMNQAMQLFRTGSFDPDDPTGDRRTGDSDDATMKINMVAAIIENFISQLVPAEIRSSVLPKRPNGEEKAENVQDWFNNDVFPNTNFNYHMDQAARVAAILGDSFVKVGYVQSAKRRSIFDEEEVRATVPDHPFQVGGTFDLTDESQYRQGIWYQVVHKNNIVPAPGALSIHDTPYLIHKIRRRHKHVLNDKRYKTAALHNLRAVVCDPHGNGPENPYHYGAWTSEPEDDDTSLYVDILEIWDYYNHEFKVISPGNLDGYLYEGDWPFPALEGYPFTHLQFKNDPQSFFGIPMIQDIADLQEELNIISRLMIESYKRDIRFTLVDDSAFDDQKMQALADARLEEFVRVPMGQGIEKVMAQWPPGGSSFSPDVYGVRNMIMQAMMLITGMTDFMMGQSQKTKSATETAATVQGFTSRLRYKSKLYRWFLRDTMRKSYQILRTETPEDAEYWVRRVGAAGMNMVPVTVNDLRAELDVDIDAEIFDDRAQDPVRLKLIIDAMSPLLNSPHMLQLAGVDIVQVMRRYFKAIGEKNIEEIQPVSAKPEDPGTENLLMQNGQKVNVHPMDDDMQHMELHIQFQQIQEQGSAPFMLAEQHIKDHGEQMEIKQQMAQQQQAALFGGNGQGEQAGEAPSRTTTPNAGEQAARTQQVSNA